jgi:hypothetical protein
MKKFPTEKMNESIKEIQGESKTQATNDNYARLGAALVVWLKSFYPACWIRGFFSAKEFADAHY